MKKRSILWEWGLSYVLLLLIPITSIFINYSINEKTIRKEYLKAYELTASNLKDNIDELMLAEKNFFYYIIRNEYFDKVKLVDTKDKNYYYNSYLLQTALDQYCSANETLNCSVYQKSVDQIYSNQNSGTSMQYYNALESINTRMPEYTEWNAFISSQYNETFLINYNFSKTDKPCLIYANTLKRGVTDLINVFTTISIEEIEFRTQYLPDNVYFILQTSNNQLCTFNNSGLLNTMDTIDVDANGKLILEKGYQNIPLASNTSDIVYHLVISKTAIDSDLQSTQKAFALNLTVTLFLGLAGIMFFLRRNYLPVSNLLAKISKNMPHKNEFQCIESVYEQLQKDYHSARMTVQHQKQQLLNSWLLSLLKGRISELEIQKQRKNFSIDLDSHVALIGIMVPLADQQNMEYDELLFFVINNIFQELFETNTFYCIEDGRFIYYLFDLSDFTLKTDETHQPNWHDYALEKADYLCSYINKNFKTSLVCVVSETVESIRHCKFLYRKIMEAFEMQKVAGGNAAIDTRSFNASESGNHIRESIELELDQAIKDGNLEAALLTSERIFSSQHTLPFSTLRVYAFDASTVIIDIFNTYNTNSAQQTKALNYVNALMQASNPEELKTFFNEMLEYVCMEISKKWQSESKKIVLRIQKYIEGNYTNQNLNVNSIADDLQRNAQYITRIFKENTGEGILNYINNYRINKALELMQTNEYTLEEISKMIGYSNVRAFRRAFIKIIGDIPSKYKN